MKKICAYLLVFSLIIVFIPAKAAGDVDLSCAKAALLCDADSGEILIEKNAYEEIEAAGLKRLPALLAICRAFDEGAIKEDTKITVSSEAASIKGPTAFLEPNERIMAGEALKAAVILNAGDSVCALIQAIYNGEAEGLEAENAILTEIGVKCRAEDTLGTELKICLSDIAKICMTLKSSGAFLKYSSVYLDSLIHENGSVTELTNPNRLVRFYSGCFGLATGSIGASEYSGAFIARRGGSTFLAVLAGVSSSDKRSELASGLLDHAFSSFRRIELGKANESVGSVPVKGGKDSIVSAVTLSPVSALVGVNETKLSSEVILPEYVEAPVSKGDKIGTLIIKNASNEALGVIFLVAGESVDRAAFSDRFLDMIRSWLRL